MPTEWNAGCEITVRRAELLAALAENRSFREAACTLHISYETVRTNVRQLREITGTATHWELRRWWCDNRAAWAYQILTVTGVPFEELQQCVNMSRYTNAHRARGLAHPVSE